MTKHLAVIAVPVLALAACEQRDKGADMAACNLEEMKSNYPDKASLERDFARATTTEQSRDHSALQIRCPAAAFGAQVSRSPDGAPIQSPITRLDALANDPRHSRVRQVEDQPPTRNKAALARRPYGTQHLNKASVKPPDVGA